MELCRATPHRSRSAWSHASCAAASRGGRAHVQTAARSDGPSRRRRPSKGKERGQQGRDSSARPPVPSKRPSTDVATALHRRIGSNGSGRRGPRDPPTRPSKDFKEAYWRRISRDDAKDVPGMIENFPDAFGREPRKRDTLDVPDCTSAPPLRGMRPRDELVFDEGKEQAREGRRYVFDFDYWANARSWSRFLFNILSIPRSLIWSGIMPPTLFVTAISVLATLSPEQWAAFTDPLPALPALAPQLSLANWFSYFDSTVSPVPITLTASTISLLHVFRTNNSYKRFDEARKMWGLALNRTRDVVRQALAFSPEEDVDHTATFARWVMVYMVSMKCHLRREDVLEDDVVGLLTAAEEDLLMQSEHKVLLSLQVLSSLVECSSMTPLKKLQMHGNLRTFEDILGECERLMMTPLPIPYTRATSRFNIFWLTFLPFLMAPTLGAATVPATFFISVVFLGIEEIGLEIEEPMSILPLEVICAKSRQDIIELVNKQGINRQMADVEFIYSSDSLAYLKQM